MMNINAAVPSVDDMPELQEVEEDQRSPGLFQVAAGVSHQELSCSPSTNWLAELANIATSPQSPLLKNAPHKRFGPVKPARKSVKLSLTHHISPGVFSAEQEWQGSSVFYMGL